MRGFRSPFLLALTPAMALMGPVFAPYLSLQHTFFYHLNGSPSEMLVACLLNIAFVWAVCAAVLWIADRVPRLRAVLWALFLSLLPLLVARDIAALLGSPLPGPVTAVLALLCPLGLVASVLLYRKLLRPQRERIYDRVCAVAALVSLSWFLTLGQFCYYAVAMHGMNKPRSLHSSLPVNGAKWDTEREHSRVIWIIFDELGYDQTFARRPKDLRLPAFDTLAAESTVFTDAVAPGDFTEQVIPALMMGEPARKIYFTTTGSLLYQNDAKSRWERFDPKDTVFADALRAGDRTGVVGWHNPYCRLLSPVLDRCYWSSRSDSTTSYADGALSLVGNVLAPGRHFLLSLEHPDEVDQAAEQRRVADLHITDVKQLLPAADRLLADSSIDFALIHLPIPHPAGIYDRRRMNFTDAGHVSYVDNLALADRVLASFRDTLLAHDEWDSSTVVLMGDHAWRTKLLWAGGDEWTAEDQEASHGGAFDPRPVYVVKLPDQHAGARVDVSFATLRTRELLDEVMEGRLKTPAELRRWVAR